MTGESRSSRGPAEVDPPRKLTVVNTAGSGAIDPDAAKPLEELFEEVATALGTPPT